MGETGEIIGWVECVGAKLEVGGGMLKLGGAATGYRRPASGDLGGDIEGLSPARGGGGREDDCVKDVGDAEYGLRGRGNGFGCGGGGPLYAASGVVAVGGGCWYLCGVAVGPGNAIAPGRAAGYGGPEVSFDLSEVTVVICVRVGVGG